MGMKYSLLRLVVKTVGLCVLVGLPLSLSGASAPGGRIEVVKPFESGKLIPIALSGYAGEVQATLQFDLEVMGFKMTNPEQAQFLLKGSSTDHVEGRLSDTVSKAELLAKAYSGPLRAQAHALADDVVLTLTGKKGIAQTKIAFKVTNGRTSEIYVSDYDGHNARQVTRETDVAPENRLVAAPCWVPGHWKLYYTSYRRNNPDIYSQDLATGEVRTIARYTGLNTSPAVSPDGTRVAMILSKAGSPDVWVSDADGKGLKQLTHTKEDESSPCWSPDGRTLCFTSRVGGSARLYTMPATGGQMRPLPGVRAANTTEPDWSPDGQTIAFTAQMGGFQIYTYDLKTQATTPLAAGEDPSWAPNSRTLIFCHRVGDRYILSLLDVPTKQVKNIAQISGSCSQPAWER